MIELVSIFARWSLMYPIRAVANRSANVTDARLNGLEHDEDMSMEEETTQLHSQSTVHVNVLHALS